MSNPIIQSRKDFAPQEWKHYFKIGKGGHLGIKWNKEEIRAEFFLASHLVKCQDLDTYLLERQLVPLLTVLDPPPLLPLLPPKPPCE